MIKKSFGFLVVFLILTISTNLKAESKIAFIDLNYVYSNSKTGKKINKEIESKRIKINKEFKDLQKKLDDEKNNLISQKNVLAEDEFKKKLVELENNLKKYNQIIIKKNKDLTDFRNKSKNEFAISLKSTLEKYAKDNSISIILRKDQILIGINTLDVTKDILELFNKG